LVEEPAETTGEIAPGNGRAGGEDGEREEESEAERRRRRRGRRGGRRRGRRENDLEPVFAEARPPSDTVEILPLSVTEEPASAPVADLSSAVSEISGPEIELARQSAPAVPILIEASAEIPEEMTELPVHPHPIEATPGAVSAAPAEREPRSLGEMERTPEAALSTAAPPGGPESPVETASERSSNPRRGWWQRLIQP
jgi:ribonuclease E